MKLSILVKCTDKFNRLCSLDCQLHLDYAKRYSCNFDWTSQTFIANADDLCHIDGDLIANVTCVDRPCDDFHYDATCCKIILFIIPIATGELYSVVSF